MSFRHTVVAFLVVLSVFQSVRADFHCSMLPPEQCSFAVDYFGQRCVLDKVRFHGADADLYACEQSSVQAGEDSPVEYIESNECVYACGVDRMTLGFSTEELSSHSFTTKMCSSECRNNCANLVDLYSNIIAGEGLTLSELCGEHRRILFVGAVAPASAPL